MLLRAWLRTAAVLCLAVASAAALAQEPSAPANDDALRGLVKAAGDSAANGGADRVMVFHRTTVDVEASGLAHIVDRQLVKVLTEAGAARLARLRFDYDPTSNTAEIRKVRVLRQNGSVETLDAARALDLPQPQAAIYWGPRMKLLAVPRLAVGDALEVESYTKGFLIAYLEDLAGAGTGTGIDEERYIPPMRGHFYDVVTFHEDIPVKLRHYEVRTPKDKPVQYEVYGGEVKSYAGFDAEHLVYRFWRENVAPFHGEPRAAAASDTQPKVVLATVGAWEDKSRWFAQVNDAQFAADPRLKAKVDELTAGLKTDDERIAAIVHWAADNIRYSGITMGKGEGYTLHPASMIYEDRSGVCKDKAGIAIAMLRAAGFSAWPAMTMAGSRVERIPADQFNHCVTALKEKNGSFRMLDPTWVPLSMELWSSAEGEQDFLVGTPEGTALARTQAFDPALNKVRLVSDAALAADGTLTGKLTLSALGVAEQRIRRELAMGAGVRERQEWFERLVAGIAPGAVVEPVAVTTAQLEDVKTPIAIEIRYRVPGYALTGASPTGASPAPAGPTLLFVPPGLRHPLRVGSLAPYLDAAELDTRTQPVQLGAPRQLEVEEKLTLPAGWRVTRVPKDRALDGPAAELKTTVAAAARGAKDPAGTTLVSSYRITVKRRLVPVESYANFRDVVREAKSLESDMVVLEKEGK